MAEVELHPELPAAPDSPAGGRGDKEQLNKEPSDSPSEPCAEDGDHAAPSDDAAPGDEEQQTVPQQDDRPPDELDEWGCKRYRSGAPPKPTSPLSGALPVRSLLS